jgi:hypothetical protein
MLSDKSGQGGTMTTLEQLIASWRASSMLHTFREGASASEIERFEASAGWKLPTEWRELYAFANGTDLFGPMQIFPLFGAPSPFDGFPNIGRVRRFQTSCGLPPEVRASGLGSSGLWLPCATEQVGPVAELRQDFGMTIAGSSLSKLLLARTHLFLDHGQCGRRSLRCAGRPT